MCTTLKIREIHRKSLSKDTGLTPTGGTLELHFQERPWDIYLTVGYSTIAAVAILGAGVQSLATILLVFFAPGYVMTAGLFPTGKSIDWIERVVMSFGVSILVVPLLLLALSVTPFGIRTSSVVMTIVVFTGFVGFAAWWRRMQVPTGDRLSALIEISLPKWGGYGLGDKMLTLALAACIVTALGALIYAAEVPRAGTPHTEFYVLGPGGNASGYPTALNASETGTVVIGIANHESATVSYTVRIDLVGVQVLNDAGSGLNTTVEVNRTTWSRSNLTLENGQNRSWTYSFSIPYANLWKVQFLLFKDGDFSFYYRELHLYVRVS